MYQGSINKLNDQQLREQPARRKSRRHFRLEIGNFATRRNRRKSRRTREPAAMFQIPRTALAWCAPRICPTVNDPGKTDDDDHFALPFFSRFRPSILETPASTSAGMHAEYRLSSSHPQSRLRAPCLPFSPRNNENELGGELATKASNTTAAAAPVPSHSIQLKVCTRGRRERVLRQPPSCREIRGKHGARIVPQTRYLLPGLGNLATRRSFVHRGIAMGTRIAMDSHMAVKFCFSRLRGFLAANGGCCGISKGNAAQVGAFFSVCVIKFVFCDSWILFVYRTTNLHCLRKNCTNICNVIDNVLQVFQSAKLYTMLIRCIKYRK